MEAARVNEVEHSFEKEAKYLSFTLASEEYGIGILKVKEIIGMMSITSVPQAPVFVKGVINLRGRVIPIVDLRLKFGMPESEFTERTCIIVVEVDDGKQSLMQMGIVVDSVSEVVNIKAQDIEPPPSFGQSGVDTSFIIGMAKLEDSVKILMDIDRVLTGGELQAMPGESF